MKTILAIHDGFFPKPDDVADRILAGEFGDFESPWDAVKYPGINKALPKDVQNFVIYRLEQITGEHVQVMAMFARATTASTGPAPHRIHCDRIMGQSSAHVYLSREWPAEAGTTFWNHTTEGSMQTPETDVAQVMADSHLPDAWRQSFACQGRFNRLLIHDSRLWHSAEPVGGWGTTPKDGRVVLTCFFNTVAS